MALNRLGEQITQQRYHSRCFKRCEEDLLHKLEHGGRSEEKESEEPEISEIITY